MGEERTYGTAIPTIGVIRYMVGFALIDGNNFNKHRTYQHKTYQSYKCCTAPGEFGVPQNVQAWRVVRQLRYLVYIGNVAWGQRDAVNYQMRTPYDSMLE